MTEKMKHIMWPTVHGQCFRFLIYQKKNRSWNFIVSMYTGWKKVQAHNPPAERIYKLEEKIRCISSLREKRED